MTSPVKQIPISTNVSINGGINSPIVSHRGSVQKNPLSKTCMNSLRSSFGGKFENFSTNKLGGVGNSPIPSNTTSPFTPVNNKKVMDPSLWSSLQGKRKPDNRRVEAENRY